MVESRTTRMQKRARKMLNQMRRLDPRIVRLHDMERHRLNKKLAAAVLGAFIALGAVSFAANRQGEAGKPVGPKVRNLPPQSARKITHQSIDVSKIAIEIKKEEPKIVETKKPSNFYDPVYVFTEENVQKVTAYPLADPPGLVVDLTGAIEPEADPNEMVGKDNRIKSIKRRTTKKGLRYIIRLNNPIKKIQTIHEGSVVLLFPQS